MHTLILLLITWLKRKHYIHTWTPWEHYYAADIEGDTGWNHHGRRCEVCYEIDEYMEEAI